VCVGCNSDSSDGADAVKRKEGGKGKRLSNIKQSQIADNTLLSASNVGIKESSVTARTAAEGSQRVYYFIMVVENRL